MHHNKPDDDFKQYENISDLFGPQNTILSHVAYPKRSPYATPENNRTIKRSPNTTPENNRTVSYAHLFFDDSSDKENVSPVKNPPSVGALYPKKKEKFELLCDNDYCIIPIPVGTLYPHDKENVEPISNDSTIKIPVGTLYPGDQEYFEPLFKGSTIKIPIGTLYASSDEENEEADEISDEDMINHAFGQGSHTAKKLSPR